MITIEKAIALATDLHSGQIDKQGKPYILHPLRVMLKVPANLQVAAVLHDVVEDCDISLDLLADYVHDHETMRVIDALTHRPNETRRAYIARICLIPFAVIIKIADIRDNLDRVWGLNNDSRMRLMEKYGDDLAQIAQAGYDVSTGLPLAA